MRLLRCVQAPATVAALLVAGALAGCEQPASPEVGGRLSLQLIEGGTPQTVPVNTMTPVRPMVRVVNSAGRGVEGVRVAFAATVGNSFAGQAITDGAGYATVNWTAGTRVGPHELTAVIAQNAMLASVVFQLTAVPGPAASGRVSVDSIALGVGAVSAEITMTLFDQFNNEIGDVAGLTVLSEDSSVAAVTGNNEVTGVAAGRTAIFVSNGAFSDRLLAIIGGDSRVVTSAALPGARSVAISSLNVAYAPDSAFGTNTLFRIDPETEAIASHALPRGQISDVQFHPDGATAYLAVGSAPLVYVVDVATNLVTDSIATGVPIAHLTITPDGSRLFGASGERLLRINTTTYALDSVFTGGASIRALVAHPTLDRVVLGLSVGSVRTYDATNLGVPPISSPAGFPQALAISPDGSRLFVTRGGGNSLQIRNGFTLAEDHVFAGVTNGIDVQVSADGLQVYVVTSNALLILPASGQLVLEAILIPGAQKVAVSPVGRTAIVTLSDGTIRFVR